ncbi:MAG: hypothetical protein EB127_24885 [Alphaproteobacteria bacterium]|nr:hypothetical protein [Alphaproteobacteria bacterium]
MKSYETPSQAYLGTLEDVYFNFDIKSSPRGQPIREKLDYTFKVLCPDSLPLKTLDSSRNQVIENYSIKENELYESCSNLAEDFGKASKFWLSLANPDGTINSAYGHLIWANKSHGSDFEQVPQEIIKSTSKEGALYITKPIRRTPWEWCIESLKRDKDTRQAILRFSLPDHQWFGNKDQTCTMHGLFLIREDRLNLSIVMRSNDLVKGLVYDLPWFCSLIPKMVEDLRDAYPTLKMGTYTHTVHSIHIYEKDTQTVLKMLGKNYA